MSEVWCDDVAFNIFTFTLEGRETTWYHSLPVNSVNSWREFKKLFLEKFVDDETLPMLLKETGNSKKREKEKLKDFNQNFNCILNKFP